MYDLGISYQHASGSDSMHAASECGWEEHNRGRGTVSKQKPLSNCVLM